MKFGMLEIGVAAVGIGIAGLSLSGWTALQVEPPPPVRPLAVQVERLDANAVVGSRADRDLLGGSVDDVAPELAPEGVQSLMTSAVANDPFRTDRRPGPGYVLPWERRSYEPPVREERDPPERPSFRVVGIAFPAGRPAAALIQREGGEPRLFRLGERVDGYELAILTPEGAMLEGPAGRLSYSVDTPFEEDDRRRRGRDDDEDDRRREALDERRAQQQMERARAEIVRAIQRRGGNISPGGLAP